MSQALSFFAPGPALGPEVVPGTARAELERPADELGRSDLHREHAPDRPATAIACPARPAAAEPRRRGRPPRRAGPISSRPYRQRASTRPAARAATASAAGAGPAPPRRVPPRAPRAARRAPPERADHPAAHRHRLREQPRPLHAPAPVQAGPRAGRQRALVGAEQVGRAGERALGRGRQPHQHRHQLVADPVARVPGVGVGRVLAPAPAPAPARKASTSARERSMSGRTSAPRRGGMPDSPREPRSRAAGAAGPSRPGRSGCGRSRSGSAPTRSASLAERGVPHPARLRPARSRPDRPRRATANGTASARQVRPANSPSSAEPGAQPVVHVRRGDAARAPHASQGAEAPPAARWNPGRPTGPPARSPEASRSSRRRQVASTAATNG